MHAEATEILERPFYFIVVLWGERFRNYFLDYCLPSLLAPGNIPSLTTRRPSKFLIATVAEDWTAMQATPIFERLERHILPVFIEIPPCPSDKPPVLHTSIGYKIACEIAYKDKAYVTLMSPDCLFSDGMVANLQRLAAKGTQMALAASIRFGEEPLLQQLANLQALPQKTARVTGEPLAIPARQLVLAALRAFHSETGTYIWGGVILELGRSPIIPAAMWRVPGEDGVVLHSLSYLAVLLDYAALERHDTSSFEDQTLDLAYYHDNFADVSRVHVVQDSDETFVASWAPLSDKPFPFKPTWFLNLPYVNSIFGWQFASSFYGGVFNSTKQRLLFLPVRWHSRPLNSSWNKIEQNAQRELLTYLAPHDKPLPAEVRLRRLLRYPALIIWLFALRMHERDTLGTIRRRANLLRSAARGDRAAFSRVSKKLILKARSLWNYCL